MAARPNQQQLLKPNARPTAPAHGLAAAAPSTERVAGRNGNSSFVPGGGGASLQSRSVEDSTTTTLLQAVRFVF